MSIPKEPRQLMINLMYLVLTAMLALNVSSEILHAFKTINQSISASNSSIQDKNNKLYEDFDANEQQEGQRDRVKPYNDKAKAIKGEAEKLVAYLEQWKEKIITQSGGRLETGEIKKEDDIDASTLLLVEQKGGDEIKNKLNDYRNLLLNSVSANSKENISKQLPVRIVEPAKSDNNPGADWKVGYFYNMPTMAVVTLLSKFQNDVRNSEAQVVAQLFSEADQEQIKFDALKAIAVPKTSYALAGQKVEAQIMLAAYNKAVTPVVTSSSGRVSKVEQGVANWETAAAGVGLQTVRGTVSIDMGGRKITEPYEFQYMVGSTGASIQLDKMNVFYIGVPNPITVSAAGYSLEDISMSIPGATLTPGTNKGQFNVMVDKPGKVTAAINAKEATGSKQVGAMEIRVKYIPDPVARIGGKSQGTMPTNIFKAQQGIVAALDAFDFDARFMVTSFQFSMLPKRGELIGPYPSNSPLFSAKKDISDAIQRAKPGDRVFFEEIKGVGPDKRPRVLNNVSFLLN
ncbi:MAG: gliding motility protein GldM [Sphingobacteriales bacterium]|nr:MAG: gliding motility protein GldM [Sphingobacteriales bacterium]